MYNRVVVSPGQAIALGSSGGQLLIQSAEPGAITLSNMRNRTWHLLREDGPDTGQAAPVTGDFSIDTVTRDLNIALAQFVSETGLSPGICSRQDTFSVFPVLDYPVPPGLVGLDRIEYTPAGMQARKLTGCSFTEFDQKTGGVTPYATGTPTIYREPYAGYVRLSPAPGPGNATGPYSGTITLSGTPNAGQTVFATFTSPTVPSPIVTPAYTVQPGDNLNAVANGLAAAISATAALSGVVANVSAANASVSFQSALIGNSGGQVTYYATVTGQPMTVLPNTVTALAVTGDTITFYYTALGVMLVNDQDTPAIPLQFHMALVYRVLMDYWRRKQDLAQAKEYERMYKDAVAQGKAFPFDSNRATQPTISGDDFGDYEIGFPG